MKKNSPLPRLSRVEFFRLNEGELIAALARAITRHADEHPDVKLTTNQQAVVAWSRVSVDVPNGGFTQFFYNHGGDSDVKVLARLLDSLDVPKAGGLLRDAAAVY